MLRSIYQLAAQQQFRENEKVKETVTIHKINFIIHNKFIDAPTSKALPRNPRNKAFKQPAIPFFNENSIDESIAT